MAINLVSNALYSPGSYPQGLPFAEVLAEQSKRVIVSRSSFTRYDGGTETTLIYSDGSTETLSQDDGDTVFLSDAAQKFIGQA